MLAVLLGFLISGALVYLARLDRLRVDQVELHGLVQLRDAAVASAVREAVGGTTWGFVPRDHFFLVSGEAIEHRLRGEFPQIRKIDVNKRFPDRLIATIEERMLWGVYCVGELPRVAARPCSYLDENGTAYEELAYFEGWLLPVIYGAAAPEIGAAAVSRATIEFFEQARQALADVGAYPLGLVLSTSTPTDGALRLAEGWQLLVVMDRPIPSWFDALETLLAAEIGARRQELEYIDLRFGNKVFYKYR